MAKSKKCWYVIDTDANEIKTVCLPWGNHSQRRTSKKRIVKLSKRYIFHDTKAGAERMLKEFFEEFGDELGKGE